MTKSEQNKKNQGEQIPQEFLTKKEIACRLRCSTRKIELDLGFPKLQWGRSVRYSWPEVVAYLKGRSE